MSGATRSPKRLLAPLLLLASHGLLPHSVLAQPAPTASWLDLDLNLQAQPLANPSGGERQGASWMQQLTLGATLGSGLAKEPQQWQEVDHWRTNLQLMLFSGDANYAESLGAAFPLQSTAHPTGLWLTEASVERQPGQGGIGVKAGVF